MAGTPGRSSAAAPGFPVPSPERRIRAGGYLHIGRQSYEGSRRKGLTRPCGVPFEHTLAPAWPQILAGTLTTSPGRGAGCGLFRLVVSLKRWNESQDRRTVTRIGRCTPRKCCPYKRMVSAGSS